MAKICLCLTGRTLARDLEILEKYRKYVDMAELRVDCLAPDERFLIRHFPEMAGVPVILTVRRSIDGGSYVGGEGSRINILANGLAFAEADRRRNFAYVDLEEDLDVPSLEEAARTFGTRIIRSWHNPDGVDDNLAEKLTRMRRVGDEIVKASLKPASLLDVIRVYQAARDTPGIEKILFCLGEYGTSTGILAELFDSRISYATPPEEADSALAAPDRPDPKELAELYRFREISGRTKIFAIAGFPLKASGSLHFFNTVFGIEQTDAVYIPVPSDSAANLISYADAIGISGISVTAPYKEEILPFLKYKSNEVIAIGACNTIAAGNGGWTGYNTDAAGFSGSLLAFAGWKDLRRKRATIIGAGGAARAVAAEVSRLKGKALILNRTPGRARSLASLYRFSWAGLDSQGANLMERYSDLIIQASHSGTEPCANEDPIELYKFSGRETVMDLNYSPAKTLFLKRAEDAGCRILNGSDMLHRQARHQYAYFMNKEFPPSLVSRVNF